MDLQHLRASDGTGEAVLAHIQTVRNPGSTVLDLDNVDNWNTKAVIITGTPAANGFVSPIGMKVMYGHLSAGDFIIDGYAPGYVDNGNTTAEVAIVKMTTNWADALIDILKNTLTDAGKIKTDAIDSETMFADVVDPVKRSLEMIFDFVVPGTGVWAGLGYGANLNAGVSAITAYINGQRGTVAAVASRAFTASKDTYIDILNTAGVFTLVYTEVANNASSPALAANSIRLAIVVSGATNILNAASINQGQPDRVLPIITSIPLQVTDQIGNLICPRDPQRKLLGYRQGTGATGSAAYVDIAGFNFQTKVPDGRKVRLHFVSPQMYVTGAATTGIAFIDVTAGTTITDANQNMGNTVAQSIKIESQIQQPAGGLRNYKLQGKTGSAVLNMVTGTAFWLEMV